MKIKNPRNMIRNGMYLIEEVLDEAKKFLEHNKKDPDSFVDYDGNTMKMASDRYKTFVVSGTKCVCCGIEGQYFYMERDRKGNNNPNSYHFNLYALDSEGNEVLMTKDHITPKSKGGKNHIDNYQTMCAPCNERKGSN